MLSSIILSNSKLKSKSILYFFHPSDTSLSPGSMFPNIYDFMDSLQGTISSADSPTTIIVT